MAVSLKKSLGLNFAGRVWSGAVAFIAIPLYLHWLGRESFGLVGFGLLLQSVLGFVNGGLADAANRETAKVERHGSRAVATEQFAFVRLAWLVGAVMGVLLAGLSGWLARHWLTLDQLGAESAQHAIQLIAVLIVLQVPIDIYTGMLLGARRHLAANGMLTGGATVRAVATIGALALIAPSIEVFFMAQIVASLLTVIAGHVLLCQTASGHVAPTWQSTWSSLRASFQFSAGMTLVTFSSMLLSQADRIILSRLLKLDEFGIYSIAVTFANLLYFLISPVQSTFYPEFSRYMEPAQRGHLTERYHQACQCMSVLILPTGFVLACFSREIIGAWTYSPVVGKEAAAVAALLIAARLIGGLNTMPYSLQFSHGWVSLVAGSNFAAVVVLLPVLAYLAVQWGAFGAALGYLIIGLPFSVWIVWRMHQRLLPGELGRWFRQDVAPSLGLSLLLAALWKIAEPANLTPAGQLAWVAMAAASTVGVVAAANPYVRAQLRGFRLFGFSFRP